MEENDFLKKLEYYKQTSGIHVDEEMFSQPRTFVKIHEKYVGTVVKRIDKNLAIYAHIIYFGCMLFFCRLTKQQIDDPPEVWEFGYGEVCPI